MKAVTIRLTEDNNLFNIRVYKEGVAFFNKEFEDELDACEYAGWLEAFYKACDVKVEDVVL